MVALLGFVSLVVAAGALAFSRSPSAFEEHPLPVHGGRVKSFPNGAVRVGSGQFDHLVWQAAVFAAAPGEKRSPCFLIENSYLSEPLGPEGPHGGGEPVDRFACGVPKSAAGRVVFLRGSSVPSSKLEIGIALSRRPVHRVSATFVDGRRFEVPVHHLSDDHTIPALDSIWYAIFAVTGCVNSVESQGTGGVELGKTSLTCRHP